MAYGYILSRQEFQAIALHDCDITTYSREMLARLCYPVVNPSLDYDFCKGCGVCATECPKESITMVRENQE